MYSKKFIYLQTPK